MENPVTTQSSEQQPLTVMATQFPTGMLLVPTEQNISVDEPT
jgi:hypothetical protein